MAPISLILQVILVTVTGRLIDNRMGDVMISDYRVVLIALHRSDPWELDLPDDALETPLSMIRFLCGDTERTRETMETVYRLDMSKMNLKHLPVYGMRHMPNLRTLILDDNPGLTITQGDIERISHLPIEEVSIRSSNINFETFKALQGLPRLTKLDISDNKLLYKLDISFKRKLQSKSADNGKFGDLAKRLVELNVSRCGLGDSWLESILECTNLTALDISENPGLFYRDNNPFCKRAPTDSCSLMRGLTSLNVSGCSLVGTWLDEILKCRSLTALDVSGSPDLFKDRHPGPDCSLMRGLVSLNIEGCSPGSDWLDEILQCTDLKSLNIARCHSLFRNKKPGPDCSFMRGLTSLNVSSCVPDDEWIDDVLRCTNLMELNISGNICIGIGKANLREFKNLKLLRVLDASGCLLTAKNFNEICKCGGLEVLSVGCNGRLWNGEVDFGECKSRLVRLNISGTEINEDGLKSICGIPRRGVLGTLFSWIGIYSENRFPNLAVLDISLNKNLGPVMSSEGFSFGKLGKTLAELNISECGITGSRVFKAISECKRLAILNATFNPDIWNDADGINFGRLGQLRMLDVSSTGLQPAVLSRILESAQLETLDISKNPTACQSLGSGSQILGGVRDTLRHIKAEKTGLTRVGLQWILEEFSGLQYVDVAGNSAITPADLTNLDYDTLKHRLVEFRATDDVGALIDLQEKLPKTRIPLYY